MPCSASFSADPGGVRRRHDVAAARRVDGHGRASPRRAAARARSAASSRRSASSAPPEIGRRRARVRVAAELDRAGRGRWPRSASGTLVPPSAARARDPRRRAASRHARAVGGGELEQADDGVAGDAHADRVRASTSASRPARRCGCAARPSSPARSAAGRRRHREARRRIVVARRTTDRSQRQRALRRQPLHQRRRAGATAGLRAAPSSPASVGVDVERDVVLELRAVGDVQVDVDDADPTRSSRRSIACISGASAFT